MLKLLLLLLVLIPTAEASCRSRGQAHKFEIEQGYPHGRKGYVIDHICPLACGGIDDPKNMQYQTYKDGKAKDKWERTTEGCDKLCNGDNSTPTRLVFNCNQGKK